MQAKTKRWLRRFEVESRQCRASGYVLQGSLVRRYLQRGRASSKKTYGPYYLWTRKIDGRTVTKALSAEQAKLIGDALRNNRRLESNLAELRRLSEQIIFAISCGVPKRKRDQ